MAEKPYAMDCDGPFATWNYGNRVISYVTVTTFAVFCGLLLGVNYLLLARD